MTGYHPRQWRDAVTVLLDVLNDRRDGVNVPAVPSERPSEFVLVRRSGGSLRGGLDRAQIDIECWSGQPGGSLVPVNALAMQVAEILRLAPYTNDGLGLISVEVDSIGFLADEISGAPRVIITATAVLKPITP